MPMMDEAETEKGYVDAVYRIGTRVLYKRTGQTVEVKGSRYSPAHGGVIYRVCSLDCTFVAFGVRESELASIDDI
jgi:hypothetical protein